MEHPDYLEHQEGPDGQYCDLLTRVPYDRLTIIERRLAQARSINEQDDAALRGLLWTEHEPPRVRDSITGEWTDDLGKAGADVIVAWRKRAAELYNAWYAVAFPGPKDRSRTARPTPPSGKKPARSATSGPR